MKTSKPTSREKILDSGTKLLSRVGLQGISLGLLAKESSMSKSGLFAHFNSKEDAEIQLLNRSVKLADTVVIGPAMASPVGLPRLEAVIENWFGWPAEAGLPGGCPVAAAMFELDDREGALRDHVWALEKTWRDFLAQLVQEAVSLEQLSKNLDVEQFVWELCGIYLSHHCSARFVKDPLSNNRARTAWNALIERSRPTQ